jgi:hypothetical protein
MDKRALWRSKRDLFQSGAAPRSQNNVIARSQKRSGTRTPDTLARPCYQYNFRTLHSQDLPVQAD